MKKIFALSLLLASILAMPSFSWTQECAPPKVVKFSGTILDRIKDQNDDDVVVFFDEKTRETITLHTIEEGKELKIPEDYFKKRVELKVYVEMVGDCDPYYVVRSVKLL